MLTGTDFKDALLLRIKKRREQLRDELERGMEMRDYRKHIGRLAELKVFEEAIAEIHKRGLTDDDEEG